jgi:hypothetical protein
MAQQWKGYSVTEALGHVFGRKEIEMLDKAVLNYLTGLLAEQLPPPPVNCANVLEILPMLVAFGLSTDEEQALGHCAQLSNLFHPRTSSPILEPSRNNQEEARRLAEPVQIQSLLPTATSTYKREEPVLEQEERKDDIQEFLLHTRSPDPKIRKMYLRELCPCHVKHDVDVIWDRIFEMVKDPDPDVRYQVMHNLADGSPASRENDVIAAFEILHNDPNLKIRRKVHQVLGHYRKTGKWNIL